MIANAPAFVELLSFAKLSGGGKPERDHCDKASERLETRLLIFVDREEFVQLRNFEHLKDIRMDVAQDQAAGGRLELFVEGDELAQRGT